MITLGNAEVDLADVTKLAALAGFVQPKPDTDDELHVRFLLAPYDATQVMQIIALITKMSPDECTIERYYLRLWWD